MSASDLLTALKGYWVPAVERCGVVLSDGKIVELQNHSPDASDQFQMNLKEYKGKKKIVATWHTHPATGPNLSIADYMMFESQPGLFHYIVSEDDVWCYSVQNGKVILHDD